jgi:hypothetical protein
MNEDGMPPKAMDMRRAASDDKSYATNRPDRVHRCRKDVDDRSGNRQADDLADPCNAYYADRESNPAQQMPLDESFLPATRRREIIFAKQADCASARQGFLC